MKTIDNTIIDAFNGIGIVISSTKRSELSLILTEREAQIVQNIRVFLRDRGWLSQSIDTLVMSVGYPAMYPLGTEWDQRVDAAQMAYDKAHRDLHDALEERHEQGRKKA